MANDLGNSVRKNSQQKNGSTIISAKDLLMMSLVRFYKQNNNAHINRIIPIIEGKSDISLRLIDWFVTNYSKKYNTLIPLRDNGYFNVYISYRQQLKAFSKQQFDPFRRRDRIKFFYDKENNWVETTIGQLNFFKWVLQNEILDYIVNNIEIIEADMVSSQKNNDKKKNQNDLRSKIINDQTKRNKEHISSDNSKNNEVDKKVESMTVNEKKSSKKLISNKSTRKKNYMNLGIELSKMCQTSNPIIGPKLVKFD